MGNDPGVKDAILRAGRAMMRGFWAWGRGWRYSGKPGILMVLLVWQSTDKSVAFHYKPSHKNYCADA